VLAKLFRKKKSVLDCKVSIVIQPTSVTVAVVSTDVSNVKQLPCPDQNYANTIANLAQEQDVAGATCYIVLAHGMYQVAQIDKPNVPESEYSKVLGFSAKDYFTIPVENQLLDHYQNVSNNTNNKLNVVACDKTIILPILAALQEINVELIGISIVDIVLTHFVKEDKANLIIFHNPGSQLLLGIIKNGQLCFSRHIHGYDNLHQLSEIDFEAGILDNLGLEVQRSIDYAIGQLKLESVANIYVSVQNFDSGCIVSSLQELFDIKVSILSSFDNEDFVRFPMNFAALQETNMDVSSS
jgi:MSHA biogenesis protein MshI